MAPFGELRHKCATDLHPPCRTKVMQKVFMLLKAKNSDTSCGHVVGIDMLKQSRITDR